MNAQRPIRILFLIAQFDTGGVQFQLYLRLKHLDRARFEPTVVVLTGGGSYLLDKVRALGVPVEVLGLEDVALARKVGRIRGVIRRLAPDVVDAMLGWDTTYGNAAATLAGVPLVIAELQNERRAVVADGRWFASLEGLALRHFCNRIVACSHQVKESYGRTVRERQPILVIHDAIDGDVPTAAHVDEDARRALEIPPGQVVIGTLGRFVEQKDHATLLRAARRVCDVRDDVYFVLGGYGPLRDAIWNQASTLGLLPRLRFAGEVTDPQRFYALCDVFALTSRWEGFPVVLMEAMAAGRPVVATRVGGIEEMIAHGESGLLADAGDDGAIAAALLKTAGDRPLRQRLGRVASERVRALYGIRRLSRDWEALYDSGPKTAREPQGENVVGRPRSANAWPDSGNRILLLRLCPWTQYEAVAADVRARYPDARIDAVGQVSGAERLKRLHHDGVIHPVPDGPFSLGAFPWTQIAAAGPYDLTVLPYNAAGRRGYLQSEAAAFALAPGRAVGVHNSGEAHRIGVPALVSGACRFLSTVPSALVLARAVAASRRRRAATLPEVS